MRGDLIQPAISFSDAVCRLVLLIELPFGGALLRRLYNTLLSPVSLWLCAILIPFASAYHQAVITAFSRLPFCFGDSAKLCICGSDTYQFT